MLYSFYHDYNMSQLIACHLVTPNFQNSFISAQFHPCKYIRINFQISTEFI